ncbi:hypothetical protein RhiJN_24819 [Ceratobasidium sp. AG-Ba]|nr:hypothetical protein RhiJN_24819 [Ceratobasidium sp. AG-Ba]
MGRYGPTNIPREERHLCQAHPLSGIRSRIPSQVEAPRPIRLAPTLRQIEAPAPLRIEPRPRNPTPYRSPSSPSSSSSSSSSASEEPENQVLPEEPEEDNARDLLFTGRNLNSNPNSNQGNRDNRSQNRTTQAKAGRIPLEIIRERRNNGQCLKCGHKGHMIKDCKSKEWYHGKTEEHIKGKEAKIEEAKDDKESSDSESEN